MASEKVNTEIERSGPTLRQQLLRPPPPGYVPNIVPLIDVLFMLLLFFLLSTRFRQEEGNIPGTLPEMGGVAASPTETIATKVTVKLQSTGEKREECTYELNGVSTSTTSAEELYTWLFHRREQLGKADDIQVIIQPRGTVRWSFVVDAFNAAMRAKYVKIGFGPAS